MLKHLGNVDCSKNVTLYGTNIEDISGFDTQQHTHTLSNSLSVQSAHGEKQRILPDLSFNTRSCLIQPAFHHHSHKAACFIHSVVALAVPGSCSSTCANSLSMSRYFSPIQEFKKMTSNILYIFITLYVTSSVAHKHFVLFRKHDLKKKKDHAGIRSALYNKMLFLYDKLT